MSTDGAPFNAAQFEPLGEVGRNPTSRKHLLHNPRDSPAGGMPLALNDHGVQINGKAPGATGRRA